MAFILAQDGQRGSYFPLFTLYVHSNLFTCVVELRWHHGMEAPDIADLGSQCRGQTSIGPRCRERRRVATSPRLGRILSGQIGTPGTRTPNLDSIVKALGEPAKAQRSFLEVLLSENSEAKAASETRQESHKCRQGKADDRDRSFHTDPGPGKGSRRYG